MQIRRNVLGWGLFFIVLGAIPLAVRAGLLDVDTVRRAFELWPLVLVGIGLGLMLGRTRYAAVGGLLVALTFGVMAGSVLAVGVGGGLSRLSGCGFGAGDRSAAAFPQQSGTLAGDARVRVEFNCGELTMTPGSGSGWTLAGTSDRGRVPSVDTAGNELTIRTPEENGLGALATNTWQVTLPSDPRVDLGLSINAGTGRLDVGAAHLSRVDLSVNAGDVRLNLSNAAELGGLSASTNAGSLKIRLPPASVTGTVSANAGSVDVCVPANSGVRFRTSDNPLSGNNFKDRGLRQSGSTWTSPNFDTATVRVDLSADANAGAINLNPEAGCE